MEKKEITIGCPVSIAGLTLIPVVQTSVHHWEGRYGALFFGIREPNAIIVLAPSGRRAFKVGGEEVSLNQLVQEFPDIEKELSKI